MEKKEIKLGQNMNIQVKKDDKKNDQVSENVNKLDSESDKKNKKEDAKKKKTKKEKKKKVFYIDYSNFITENLLPIFVIIVYLYYSRVIFKKINIMIIVRRKNGRKCKKSEKKITILIQIVHQKIRVRKQTRKNSRVF